MPVQMLGTSAAHISVSETTTASHASRSRLAVRMASNVGLPDSSQELHVDREPPIERQQPPHGLDLVEHLALVVHRPPSEALAVDDDRLERR
jgi:hypothetical protein